MPKEPNMEASLAATGKSLQISTELDEKRSKRSSFLGGAIGSAIERSQTPNPTVQAMAPVMTAGFKLLQSKIDNLTTHSEMIMNGLDGLTKIHPFISVAVLAFKTAIKFEVTRRQNDKRILAVRVAMNDLFSVLLLLKKIGRDEPGQDGILIEHRLAKRISSIADDIKECTKVCDTFQSKRTIVKLFRSLEWEGKLEGFITMFEEHKKAIDFDLSMHASIRIEQVHTTLAVVADVTQTTSDNTSMVLLLQLLRSPEERELKRFIDSRGGPEQFLKRDDLMQELIKRSGESEAKTDSKGPSRKGQPVDLILEIKRDVNKTVADLISENYDQFMGKFDAQQEQLRQQMDASVRREGDRIITAITGGPHERIIDPDMYLVWKDMGWKSTTKARHLVMALREFYSERRKDILSKERQSIDDVRAVLHSANESPSRKVLEITEIVEGQGKTQEGLQSVQDDWALEYITISRIQPLLEAFDDDASSLVSVAEVNAFTTTRPKGWSLPQWMAYWTAGFPLTLRHYYTRVQLLLSRMGDRVRNVLRVNRTLVDALFCDYYSTKGLDSFLAGVHSSVQDLYVDSELFERFKDYIETEEARMEKTLSTVKYCIDADNTLELITGPGRLEKYAMPLIYLLLVRAYQVVGLASEVAINPKEVSNIIDSFEVVFDAISSRVGHMKAMCKLQNLSLKEQLQKVSHGMFYYMEFDAELPQTKYWSVVYSDTGPLYYDIDGIEYSSLHWDACWPTYADLDAIKALPPGNLLYPAINDTLDLEAYDGPSDLTDVLLSRGASTWCGSYSYKGYDGTFIGQSPAGIITIPLPSNDGPFSGSGTDSIGEFTITGRLEGDSTIFTKQYTSGELNKWRYEGRLDNDRGSIEGEWGSCDNVGDDLEKRLGLDDVQGRFDFHVAPLRLRTSDSSNQQPSSARDRWQSAIGTVRELLRIKKGLFSWDYLKDRRRIRHRFLELFLRLDESRTGIFAQTVEALSVEEAQELSTLVSYCSKADLRFYRSLSAYLQRRSVVHWGTYCDAGFQNVLPGVRYVCLDCMKFDPDTGALSNTIDLCSKCTEKPVERSEDDMHHTPAHELLQLTCCIHRRLEPSTFKFASEIAEGLKKDDVAGAMRRTCRKCGTSCERPYWYCYDCPENTCFCLKCKADLDLVYSPVPGMQFAYDIPQPDVTAGSTSSGDQDQDEEVASTNGSSHSEYASLAEGDDDAVAAVNVVLKNEAIDEWGEGDGVSTVTVVLENEAIDEGGEGDAAATAPEDGVGTDSTDDATAPGAADNVASKDEAPAADNATAVSGSDANAEFEPDGHSYEHKMILCRAIVEGSSNTEPAKPTVEEQLASLNERFDTLESRIMERLEEMMARLLGSTTVNHAPTVAAAEVATS